MRGFLQDIRQAYRAVRKNPWLTLLAITALALGIGANTVMFSSTDACLLRPFAFKDLDRAVSIWETVPKQDEDHLGAAPANFLDWREWNKKSKAFDLLAASHGWNVNLTGADLAERVEGAQVTSDFFGLLGIAPERGRYISGGDFEAGRTSVVVLSHSFWQRHLGADPQIVGRNLLLNGTKSTVIGVMPADFDFPVGADVWAPLDFTGAPSSDRANHYLQVIGRLRAGVSAEAATADLGAVADRLGQQYPSSNAGHGVRVVGLVKDLTFGTTQFVLTLLGASVFVLLLACANVTNLNLARAAERQKEIALRIALGASRWRIVRQLLTEGVLVSLLAAGASLVLAAWELALSRNSVPAFIIQHVPGMKHLAIDMRVLMATLALGVASGILSSLAPAFQAAKGNVNDVLKEGGRGGSASPARSRLRGLLVATEVALAMILMVGAALMVRGFRNMTNQDPGFDRTHVLTFYVSLAPEKYQERAAIRNFYDQALGRLSGLPGVESAAVITSLPVGWSWNTVQYRAEDQPPPEPGDLRLATSESVTPDYLRALRIPLLQGRFITAEDGPDATPTVVINRALADRLWPRQNAVGKRLRLGPESDTHAPWRMVVGVVGDTRQSSFDSGMHPTTYVPFAQAPSAEAAFALRTPADPLALAPAARAALKGLDPDQPPYDIRTLAGIMSDNNSGVEYSAHFMMAFGILAVFLSAAGIFAVMAYSVRQRTHEIGIRTALGAQRFDTFRLVVGHALKLALIGLAVGIPCALALTLWVSSLLFGILKMDAPTFVGIALMLGAVAVLAAYFPARWATKVDPIVALRHD